MSLIATQTFKTELYEKLSDSLTVRQLQLVMNAAEELLSNYEIERCFTEIGNTEFDEVLAMFLDTKRIEGRSEKTLERYRYIINRFRKQDPTPIKEITVNNLRKYLASEKDRGICDNTLRGYRDVFCSFFGWAHRESLIPRNPCANLNPIKCKKEVRLPYSNVDIEKLKEASNSNRDKALIMFLLSTGCRISEVCGLNITDIDFQNQECTVLGKGNKERTVYFDSVCAMQLKNYLDTRNDSNEALFIGKGTDRIHAGGVRRMLNKIAARAGVENVHPHRFRRTLATNLINHGMPVQEVAFVLGHEKLDTTMKYVYTEKNNVKNAYRKYC